HGIMAARAATAEAVGPPATRAAGKPIDGESGSVARGMAAASSMTGPRADDRPARLGSPLRAAVRLTLYLAMTLALIPLQAAALAVGGRLAERLPLFDHRRCWRVPCL